MERSCGTKAFVGSAGISTRWWQSHLFELSGAQVAALVAPDSVESQEEDAFAAVLARVKEDEAGRKAELDTKSEKYCRQKLCLTFNFKP